MSDARYEDGADRAVSLIGRDEDDLAVISALVQDAVLPMSEMRYVKARREFAMLLNRFRWEDRDFADREARGYERVQAVLLFRDVLSVRSDGLDRDASDTVLSLLSVAFTRGDDGTGRVTLALAGDGTVVLEVEALDVSLNDVTRPYLAPSKSLPRHGDDEPA